MSEETQAAEAAPAPVEAAQSNDITTEEYVAEKRAAREAAQAEQSETVEDTQDAPNDDVDAPEADKGDELPLEAVAEEESTEDQPQGVEVDGEEVADEQVEPPQFWTKEGKEHFATLDKVTQAYVSNQTKLAQANVSRIQTDLEQTKSGLQQDYQAKQTQLDNVIGLAEAFVATDANFSDDDLYKAILSGDVTPEQAQSMKLHRDAHTQRLEQLKAEVERAKTANYQSFVKTEFEKLAELSPDLHKSQETRTEVAQYLIKAGVPEDGLKNADAVSMSIAHKAMLWDKSQDKLAKAPKKAAVPPKRVSRPKKAAANQTSKLKTAKQRFNQSGSRDDYVAYQAAKREAAANAV